MSKSLLICKRKPQSKRIHTLIESVSINLMCEEEVGMQIILAAVVVGIMIATCYLTAGSSLVAGTIFERKTNVNKK